MRVLFIAPPRVGLYRGGLEIQIERTANALHKLGHEVRLYNPWIDELSQVDICHAFTFEPSLLPFFIKANTLGKPTVLSTVSNLSSRSRVLLKMQSLASLRLPGFYSELKAANALCRCATAVIAQTQQEAEMLVDVFDFEASKLSVVENGMREIGGGSEGTLFRQTHGLSDFVLSVGAIDKNKNQKLLIRLANRSGFKLVIIGKASTGSEEYERECRTMAGDTVTFLGYLPPDSQMLASAYSAAKVLAIPSYRETWSLVLYEGAMSGCNLVASSSIPLLSGAEKFLERVDPNDEDGWFDAIQRALTRDKDSRFRDFAANRIPTWDAVGADLAEIYASVQRRGR